MDVILDANIFIADLWLQSQRFRFLLDYLAKTNSHLWLLEPVEMEVCAYAKRSFTEALVAVQSALTAAKRKRIAGLPDLQIEAIADQAFASWSRNFQASIGRNGVKLALRDAVLAETLRRSVERIPPCSVDGGQMRDTVIWLNALEYCLERATCKSIAFVSSNVKDFADTDKRSLHPRLKSDVVERDLNVVYYSGLEDFLRDHAEPLRHITLDWIIDRIDEDALKDLIKAQLRRRPDRYFRPTISYRDEYEIEEFADPYIFPFSIDINEFYVWKFEEGAIEINLICSAQIEADIECRRTHFPYTYDPERELDTRLLTCAAEIGVEFSVDVFDEELSVREIEDCYGL